MRYDYPEERRAFTAGARTAIDAVAIHLQPTHVRELEQWLSDLGGWTNGDPPLAPDRWRAD